MTRRAPLAGLSLVALLALAGCGAAPAPDRALGPALWTRFAATPANDAVLAGSRLAVHWHQSLGAGPDMLSLSRGVLYVGGINPPYGVYAYDARTGSRLWATPLPNQVMTTPLHAHGLIFVGTGNNQWTDPARTFDLTATGLVRGTGNSALVALSARTGRVRWQIATRGENMPTPVYHHGVLYAVGGGGHVRAVDAGTGRVLWTYPVPSYVSMSSPTLVGNLLIFGGAHPYAVYAVNIRTHRLAWSTPVPQAIGGVDDCSPAVSGGVVVTEASVGRWGGRHVSDELIALRAATGQILWRHTLGTGTTMPQNMETAPPLIRSGVVYDSAPVTSRTWALRLSDGQPLWNTTTRAPVKSAPVVHGKALYLADVKGRLYRMDAATGRIASVQSLGGLVANNYPVLAGRTLFVADRGTGLWALAVP